MHRSGTSALAGLLVHLGAQAPGSLMPPNSNNLTGYWESVELYKFHERLLRSAGSSWNDWRRFNPDWINAPTSRNFSGEFTEIIEREFGQARFLIIKDPRICRLVPFWLRQLRAMNIEPTVVMPIRNPLEVARSLEIRDGFSTEQSLLIWLRHVLDAEFETRRVRRSLVLYDDLLRNWRAVASRISEDLAVKWPPRSSSVELEIESFLDPKYRHHVIDDDLNLPAWGVSEWVIAAYKALTILSTEDAGQGHRKDAQATLDVIRQDFDRISAIFGPIVRQYEVRTHALGAELADIKAELSDRETRAKELELALRGMRENFDRVAKDGRTREVEIAEQTRRANEFKETLEQVQGEHDAAVKEAERRALESQQFGLQIVELKRVLENVRREHDWVIRELKKQLDERAGANATLESVVCELREKQQQLEMLMLESSKLRIEADGRASRLQAELKSFQARLNESIEARNALDTQVAQQRAELYRLSNETKGQREKLRGAESLASERKKRLDILLSRHSQMRIEARQLHILERLEYRRIFSRDVQLIGESQLFDREWYLEQNPDVRAQGIDPVEHYLDYGAWEGRDPNPWFDSDWYLWEYPDVFAANVNPLIHYLLSGAKEGRNPGPRFNTLDYLARTPNARASDLNPLAYFLINDAKA